MEGIADLSAQAQLPQLRVLQEIESEPACGVRLIAAANRDLPADAANGTFRSDLFGRLNGIPIEIPPPPDRKEGISLRARYFLTRYAGRAREKLPSLTRRGLAAGELSSY